MVRRPTNCSLYKLTHNVEIEISMKAHKVKYINVKIMSNQRVTGCDVKGCSIKPTQIMLDGFSSLTYTSMVFYGVQKGGIKVETV